MKLIKCPQCDHIIDVDDVDIEELSDSDVIGCGKGEGDFLPCDGCACQYDPAECENVRRKQGLTQTLVGEICDD